MRLQRGKDSKKEATEVQVASRSDGEKKDLKKKKLHHRMTETKYELSKFKRRVFF